MPSSIKVCWTRAWHCCKNRSRRPLWRTNCVKCWITHQRIDDLNMNGNFMQVLIVEDSEHDAIVLLAELERKGCTPPASARGDEGRFSGCLAKPFVGRCHFGLCPASVQRPGGIKTTSQPGIRYSIHHGFRCFWRRESGGHDEGRRE